MYYFRSAIIAGLCLTSSAVVAQDQLYDLNGFDRVVVGDGVHAEIVVGPDYAVTAEALRGDIDRLEVEVRGGSLVISRDQAWGFWARGKGDRFAVQLTMPALAEVESTAGASIEVMNPGSELTRAQSTSGASLIISGAELEDIVIDTSSGARVEMSGRCSGLDAQSSSGASLMADDLICETADLQSSGGASLQAHASQTVRAQSSSGASIRLAGGAEVLDSRVSSGARIQVD